MSVGCWLYGTCCCNVIILLTRKQSAPVLLKLDLVSESYLVWITTLSVLVQHLLQVILWHCVTDRELQHGIEECYRCVFWGSSCSSLIIITGQSGLRFQGNGYQRHCGLLIGIKNEYPVFGHLRHIHIIDGSREPFHVS